MPLIIDHNDPDYQARWSGLKNNRFNGAYYYSREIVSNIIPLVRTDRNWITVNQKGRGADHSIVFVHNNLDHKQYEWLGRYSDLILACGVASTCEKVSHLGTPIHLPLSVDVKYVEKFKCNKDRGVAFVGRHAKRRRYSFGKGVDMIEGLPRDGLLKMMARYNQVYAVGRCAIEAKILGCEILPYDKRFPDPSIWKVLDNRDAAKLLQAKLDIIDGGVDDEEEIFATAKNTAAF